MPGQKVQGTVTKLTNFGVFVELEPGLEGLLHISELTDEPVESPEEVVKVGEVLDVKVLRVDAKDRKIGLSRKNVDDGQVPEHVSDELMGGGSLAEETAAAAPTAGPAAVPAAAAAPAASSPTIPSPASSSASTGGGKKKDEPKKDLRGGTGPAGPLFALPGAGE